MIELRSNGSVIICRAKTTTKQKPGHLFLPFHWNDAFAKNLSVNAVTSSSRDPLSGQPGFKYSPVVVSLFKHRTQGVVHGLKNLKMELDHADYWVKCNEKGFDAYTFASKKNVNEWKSWFENLVSLHQMEILELEDSHNQGYRLAAIAGKKLAFWADFNLSPNPSEQSKKQQLFHKEYLTDDDRIFLLQPLSLGASVYEIR